jgi:hypothetical protein
MIETTFTGTIGDLRHKRPQTAGTPPATTVRIDADALEAGVADKLFQMQNGKPVQITISEIQKKLPVEGQDRPPGEPAQEEMPTGVPPAFAEVGGADPTQPV